MPKKFQGENTKAAVAKARKAAEKEAADAAKQKLAEDEYWRDDDKKVKKKQTRKEDADRKKHEQQQRKAEAKELLEKEMNSIKINSPAPAKVTRAQIQLEKEANEKKRNLEKRAPVCDITENLNRLKVEGEEARTVEEAIAMLDNNEPSGDRHPERRMKAAYLAFEETNMARLKNEYPNLRLSQLKQMLRKEWMRSPSNPVNQKSLAYNEKR